MAANALRLDRPVGRNRQDAVRLNGYAVISLSALRDAADQAGERRSILEFTKESQCVNVVLLNPKWTRVERARQLLANPEQLEEITRGLDLFARREKLLPPSPHLVYPDDALPGESAIDFYGRAWKPFADLGALFQDDIKRLGDPKLVKAIHNQSVSRGVKATDVLPPPRGERMKLAFATATVGSAQWHLAEQRLRQRQAEERYRNKGQVAPKK